MKNYFDIKNLSSQYAEFYRRVESEKSGSIFGACEPLKIAISSGLEKKLVYVTADFVTAGRVLEMFQSIYGKKAQMLKPSADNFTFSRAKNNETNIDNLATLSRLATGEIQVLVLPVSAILSLYPSKSAILNNLIKIKVDGKIEPSALAEKLVKAGYKREELVSAPCQFALRGDILDVFPMQADTMYRVEFFDQYIETICELDGQTMKKGKSVKAIDVLPCSNVFFEDGEQEAVQKYLSKCLEREFEDGTAKEDYVKNINDLKFKLDSGLSGFSLDYIFPLIKNKSSIFDYLEDSVVLIDECKMVYDECVSFEREKTEQIKRLEKENTLLSKTGNTFAFSDFLSELSNHISIAFQKITNTNRFFNPKVILNIKSSPVSRYTHNLSLLAKDLKKYDFDGYRSILFAGTNQDAEYLKKTLLNSGVELEIANPETLSQSNSCLVPFLFASGFILPDEKIFVLGTYDILPRKAKENKLKIQRSNVFSIPKVGDYVVHSFHGIGICEGVTKLSGNFGTKDYVVVRYRDGDKLYVPIDQMNMLDKFSGAEAPKRLSKIGGQEFAKVKEKVKASVKKLAFDLLTLYAEREKKKGFAYSKDTDLQVEFENSFPYTETEDQLVSISEIKQDMEQGKVMDRLLCGDVGFGKTEVALRAAFKAIVDGKQVAFMAPTTILCEQHYNTARSRMDNFGVKTEVLNRFKTPKQAREILKKLATGEIDVLCGTHRILSSDVNFKDLGLIILDEEQKFGVEDKEKIKLKYPNVDVLTLSATPIPRTLHMSLSGIRDVSIISTPPSQRLPIATYVTEYSPTLVKDAIEKEMARNGQTFILYNSVAKIYDYAERVRKIVPNAKILVGHGQMSGKELEDIIYKFYHGEADVLICTTIIENGIDIENANTLIVVDSDHFGLSQLYQLRGRVGRGNRMAYAYLTYDANKVLTEDAYKRLDAISEFTEFGSGFKLAMRDLEIRGSGNVLGAEQHGHMEKVGYELYSKLLAEAVNELRFGKVQEETDVQIKVAVDAFIPDTYITKSEDRMVAYKTIAGIRNDQDRDRVIHDFTEVFGQVPKVVLNLIDVAYIKAKAAKLKAESVVSSQSAFEIVFDSKDKIIGNEEVGELIFKFRAKCSLDFTNGSKICFKRSANAEENFNLLKEFMKAV